jgi:hypothetical protein
MHPPIDIEIWQGSRITRPFVEPPEHHTGLKIDRKSQKSENFRFDVEIFAGVTPNFDCCRNVKLVFRVTRHTQCRFERNTTVYTKASTYMHSIRWHIQLAGGTFHFGNLPGLAPTVLGKGSVFFFTALRSFPPPTTTPLSNPPANRSKARQNAQRWHQLEAYRHRPTLH